MSTTPLHRSMPRKLDDATEQLQTRLLRQVGQTISDYGLIEAGDKIMVCLSGGEGQLWAVGSSARPAGPCSRPL